MRPMFLEFPNDAVAKNNSAESQFMFGSDWLISPVTTSNATTWPVYLPTLNEVSSVQCSPVHAGTRHFTPEYDSCSGGRFTPPHPLPFESRQV